MSLAHPSGWAIGDDGDVRLRQYPGTSIAPGKSFACMETVLGVSPAGEARKQFVDYVRSRMRRVVRGHVGPYGIFSNFGSWSLRRRHRYRRLVRQKQRRSDPAQPRPAGRKPKGHRPAVRLLRYRILVRSRRGNESFRSRAFSARRGRRSIEKLDELGIKPGLWTASTPSPWCTLNPKFAGCCSAEEPFRSAFIKAHRDHIRDEGVRMCKFDCLSAMCNNPDAQSSARRVFDRSHSQRRFGNALRPWTRRIPRRCSCSIGATVRRGGFWTPTPSSSRAFSSRGRIPAARPRSSPATASRKGSIRRTIYCQDVPALGKDSLGIWLSDWWWNSSHRQRALAGGFRDGSGPRQSAAATLGRLGLALAAPSGKRWARCSSL